MTSETPMGFPMAFPMLNPLGTSLDPFHCPWPKPRASGFAVDRNAAVGIKRVLENQKNMKRLDIFMAFMFQKYEII